MLTRLTARVGAATAVVGATMAVLTVPALAGPAVPAQTVDPPHSSCAEPVAGGTVCLNWRPYSYGHAYLTSSLTIDDPVTGITTGEITLEACGSPCFVQERTTAAGGAIHSLATGEVDVGRGVNYYQVNATWTDRQGNVHTVSFH